MASLYKREKSPFYWIKYKDPVTGKTCRTSTGFRVGIGIEAKKARDLRAAYNLKEAEAAPIKHANRWAAWVPAYMEIRYANSDRTLTRARECWGFLSLYLEEKGILQPQMLTREHCISYVQWRRRVNKAEGFNGVSHNTALLELRYLSVVLGEAVRRGMVNTNPCRDLGLKEITPKPKPEMTDEEIAKIRAEIKIRSADDYPYKTKYNWGHFLRVSFEIAIHQGCRISETYLDVHRDVDIENMTIRFHAKGDRYYETALNPGLIPLIKELRASGHRMTYEQPKQRTMLSLVWHKFFCRIGLSHLKFHSTRVTAISRLERAGAPEVVVMQLVNHASSAVHRIYRRVMAKELSKFWPGAQVGPGSSAALPPSSQDQDAPDATKEHE